ESLTPDDALQVLGENFALRQRVQDAEFEAELATENRLDDLAYATFDTREEFKTAADELLENGAGGRLAVLAQSWSEVDPAGAASWAESREYLATVASAQVGAQAMEAA